MIGIGFRRARRRSRRSRGQSMLRAACGSRDERRWSPAAPAGSARRSAGGSPPRAPRSWVGDINVEGAEEVAAEVGGAGGRARRHRPRLGARPRSSSRAARHPRQQRRHRRVRLLHRHHPEQWRAGAGGQPRRASSPAPTPRCRGCRRRLRADRQHRLRGRPGRLEGLGRLLGREGRRDRVHEGDRARERPLRDHRERDRPGPDRDAAADGRQGVRRDRREDHRDDEGARPSCAASASPTRSRPRSPSWPPTTPPT